MRHIGWVGIIKAFPCRLLSHNTGKIQTTIIIAVYFTQLAVENNAQSTQLLFV